MTRREILALASGAPTLFGQAAAPATQAAPGEAPVEWICPMDPEVREKKPGICPRCKMRLVAGIPEPVEYPLRLSVTPRAWRPGQRIQMHFEVLHPLTGKRVTKFQEMHERLFHLFLVSGDLDYFAHEHPEVQRDGTFLFETSLPKPGFYRVLGDFYPDGGTPQLAVQTIFSAGTAQADFATPRIPLDRAPSRCSNIEVALRTEPAQPLAGVKTQLHFSITPPDGIQTYLGAWGHLLVASADLIDLVHTHPFIAEGGPEMQFDVVFARPGTYRLWPQFQRKGVVNTARFTLDVTAL